MAKGLRQFMRLSLALCAGGLMLAGCSALPPATPSAKPKARPDGLDTLRSAPSNIPPSPQSAALATYYDRLQNGLVAQGLLRTDGGGRDTPYTAEMLARNFEQIAFYDEYVRGAGLRRASTTPGQLRRWARPVRLSVEFGPSVGSAQRNADRSAIAGYAERLTRLSNHPISLVNGGANFHVLIMGEDDREEMLTHVRRIAPNMESSSLSIFRHLPRSIHCFVVAFSGPDNDQRYVQAIALVRAEHPDLLRRSCFHEELAQGLGLANDSPAARPSIFNDDDEFALLTTHDALLLRILYDPRLEAGMSAQEAMPIVRQIATELSSGSI